MKVLSPEHQTSDVTRYSEDSLDLRRQKEGSPDSRCKVAESKIQCLDRGR